MSADRFPRASVIVVGYNSRRFLDVCFSALTRQAYPGDYEILFVDNASEDGSADYVRSHFPTVRVIETGENRGYAGGNNVGARVACGEMLAFINPDTRAEPGWLTELIRPLLLDPAIGLTTSKIVLMDRPHLINTCGNDLTLAGIATCHRAGEVAELVVTDEDVTAVSGAAFAIPADLFRHLGGFDERFWMYLEDTDLSWRARLAGYRCRLAARSVVAHHYTLTLSPEKTRILERNRYQMLAKNLSGWMMLALVPTLLIGELVTWGWAAMRGPRHLWAKLLAMLWVLGHMLELCPVRHATQALRRIPDGPILRQHLPAPPIAAVATGLAARVAAWVIVPLAVTVGMLALGLMDAAHRFGSVAEPHVGSSMRVVMLEDQER